MTHTHTPYIHTLYHSTYWHQKGCLCVYALGNENIIDILVQEALTTNREPIVMQSWSVYSPSEEVNWLLNWDRTNFNGNEHTQVDMAVMEIDQNSCDLCLCKIWRAGGSGPWGPHILWLRVDFRVDSQWNLLDNHLHIPRIQRTVSTLRLLDYLMNSMAHVWLVWMMFTTTHNACSAHEFMRNSPKSWNIKWQCVPDVNSNVHWSIKMIVRSIP